MDKVNNNNQFQEKSIDFIIKIFFDNYLLSLSKK